MKLSMGIFQFTEDEAADGPGLQVEDQGELGIQELLGIIQEILVRLMEFPSGGELRTLVPVEGSDHAHELGRYSRSG